MCPEFGGKATLFPNQTGYIEISAARKRLSVDFANQITYSGFVSSGRNDGSMTIELSWHSGQVSRIMLEYVWGPNVGAPIVEARIASATDTSFRWRNRFNWHSVRLAAST
jgi:hypothetical protein